ncbi:MAG: DUF951 domain-containing protein [Alicyclobacillus sp.]|nr:DUF951 domain-containing protein [Alicyclobacillus sp.]
MVEYHLGDVVQLKKPHACGENAWQIIRMGMDIRVKCRRCGHSVLIPRVRFERVLRAVLSESMKLNQTQAEHGEEP